MYFKCTKISLSIEVKSKYVRKALEYALEKDSLYLSFSIGHNKSTQIKDAVTAPKNSKNRKTSPAGHLHYVSFSNCLWQTQPLRKSVIVSIFWSRIYDHAEEPRMTELEMIFPLY